MADQAVQVDQQAHRIRCMPGRKLRVRQTAAVDSQPTLPKPDRLLDMNHGFADTL